jgi:hypothetical protein
MNTKKEVPSIITSFLRTTREWLHNHDRKGSDVHHPLGYESGGGYPNNLDNGNEEGM